MNILVGDTPRIAECDTIGEDEEALNLTFSYYISNGDKGVLSLNTATELVTHSGNSKIVDLAGNNLDLNNLDANFSYLNTQPEIDSTKPELNSTVPFISDIGPFNKNSTFDIVVHFEENIQINIGDSTKLPYISNFTLEKYPYAANTQSIIAKLITMKQKRIVLIIWTKMVILQKKKILSI